MHSVGTHVDPVLGLLAYIAGGRHERLLVGLQQLPLMSVGQQEDVVAS